MAFEMHSYQKKYEDHRNKRIFALLYLNQQYLKWVKRSKSGFWFSSM
jgi:hypothetical protein